MFAFPWYHVSFFGASYSSNVLSGPGSFFSIVALIVLIALLAEFALRRLSSVEFPAIPVALELAAAGSLCLEHRTGAGPAGFGAGPGCYGGRDLARRRGNCAGPAGAPDQGRPTPGPAARPTARPCRAVRPR